MKLTRTKIGFIIDLIYLAIFSYTVFLAIFDNREGWGNFFPGVMALPWSLLFWITGIKSPLVQNPIILIGVLINAWLIYKYFKHIDKDQKTDK